MFFESILVADTREVIKSCQELGRCEISSLLFLKPVFGLNVPAAEYDFLFIVAL